MAASGTTFALPDLGEGLSEAEVRVWYVNVGDQVKEHQPLLSVETDKAVVDIPSPFNGVVLSLTGGPGSVVSVGDVLAVFEVEEGTAPVSVGAASVAPVDASPADSAANETIAVRAASAQRRRVRASPVVRRLARDLHVDLDDIAGTGSGGIVTRNDVERRALPRESRDREDPIHEPVQAAPTDIGGTTTIKLRGVRRAMARSMTAAAAVPHITSHREVEVGDLLRWRDSLNGSDSSRPSVTITMLIAVCAMRALRRVPMLNATYDPDAEELRCHQDINLGMAVATGGGLVVPVIRKAEEGGVLGLADRMRATLARAHDGALSVDDVRGGTFTISNYGTHGGWYGTPLLRLPEVAIAGFGAIAKRPWVTDEPEPSVVVASVLPFSVSVDRRSDKWGIRQLFGPLLA
jgi:pyruvate dehydrogenase E2 component (dihydrolipoamide acetyltransferase)